MAGRPRRPTGRHRAAREYLQDALRLAQRRPDPVPGSIYPSLGQIEWKSGNMPLALDYYRRAHDAFQAAGNRRGAASARNAAARVHYRQARFEEAEAMMTSALAEREELGEYFGRFHSNLSLAELYRDAGDWAGAERHASAALTLAEESGNGPDIVDAPATGLEIRLRQGRSAELEPILARWRENDPDAPELERYRVYAAWAELASAASGAARAVLEEMAVNGSDQARLDALTALALCSNSNNESIARFNSAIAAAEAQGPLDQVAALRATLAQRTAGG